MIISRFTDKIMNSVDVESGTVNSDESDDKTFINTLLGEMKSQFNKTDHKVEYTKTEEKIMTEDALKSSLVEGVPLEKPEVTLSTNEMSESLDIEEGVSQLDDKSNDEDLDGKPRIVLLFKKPSNESPKNKDNSPGRRSLRNKNNSVDDKLDDGVLKRSSRRRSKDCNESILQSAIARKEKSYNESNKPQRLTRQLKPTQKILENLAIAKQEKSKVKPVKSTQKNKYDSDNETLNSDDNTVDTILKKNKRPTKSLKKNPKKLKTNHNVDSGKESDSDRDSSLSPDVELNVEGARNTRRSQRISSSRTGVEPDEPSDPSPNIADQAKDFPDDPECSSVGAQLIASRLCLCTNKTKLYADANENDAIYCAAVDNIGEKLIGCSRTVDVKETSLLRPSQRVPYLLLCSLHRNRMLRHNCCPTCGIFCTQGNFVECDAKHQYHRSCQISVGNVECCPHCGLSTPSHDIVITMHCTKKPIILPVQKSH